jgi:glutathione S-transferase
LLGQTLRYRQRSHKILAQLTPQLPIDNIARFYNAPDRAIFTQKCDELASKFSWVEQSLGNDGYFAGDKFSLVDAVYGPIFRYFDVLDRIDDFGVFTSTPMVNKWRQLLQSRPSIQQAVTEDYEQRLVIFFKQRNSYLSTIVTI